MERTYIVTINDHNIICNTADMSIEEQETELTNNESIIASTTSVPTFGYKCPMSG